MIDRVKILLMAQIIGAMEDSLDRLEEAYKKKNTENLEKSKRTILEFQEKLNRELKNE